jgi:hypothetical protein
MTPFASYPPHPERHNRPEFEGGFEPADPPVLAPHPNPLPAAAGRGRDPREAWEGEGQKPQELPGICSSLRVSA